MTPRNWLDEVRFSADGLVPVVAQAARTGEVLMVAWANREALELTARTGQAHYWSRSRKRLWNKGESSGHSQAITEIRLDCDGDTILYRVDQTGPACHEGTATCFSRVVTPHGALAAPSDNLAHTLTRLAAAVARRATEQPEGSYTARLLAEGLPRVSQKVGEEALEVVIAAHTEAGPRLASEAADLLFHLLVLLQARSVPLDAVWDELESRKR
ncbi:MAG: bifunctional phosphoribosyl-AMP cyclohydrolase/phosphoribosyl-ATP diphosphatase HisIE [Gemmatimonadota bacterium]